MWCWSISRSRRKLATNVLRRSISSSSCLSRRISSGSRPANVFFQLKSVARLMPAFRQVSATGKTSPPRLKIYAFYASENPVLSWSPLFLPSRGSSRKLQPKTIQFLGRRADQLSMMT